MSSVSVPVPASSTDCTINSSKEEWELQRDAFKHSGDAAYRSKDYSSAVAHYTDALAIDPSNHVLLSNRSAAYLSMGERGRALRDGKKCTEVNRGWARGWTRVASAEEALGRYRDAAESYRKALEREDSTKGGSSKTGIQRCDAKVREDERRATEKEVNEREMEIEIEREREKEIHKLKEKEKVVEKDGSLLKDFLTDVENDSKKKTKEVEKESDLNDAGIFSDIKSAQKIDNSEQPSQKDEPPPAPSEDDLLSSFFSSVDGPPAPLPKPAPKPEEPSGPPRWKRANESLGTAEDQIARLVETPNAFWRNLNPFAVLDLPHTSLDAEIKMRYRALANLLHPDKCRLEKADAAFDTIKRAHEIVMRTGEDSVSKTVVEGEAEEITEGGLAGKDRKYVVALIEAGMKRGKREHDKAKKKAKAAASAGSGLDAAAVAAAATAATAAAVAVMPLEEHQERAVQKVFAELDYKRRDVEERVRKNESRERGHEEEEQQKLKREREFERGWREGDRVKSRIGNWRDFNKKKKKG